MSELKTTFLPEARVKLAEPIVVGDTPEGHRMIVNVEGGAFEGPGIKGHIVPRTGADWSRVRANGSAILDVRFCLQK